MDLEISHTSTYHFSQPVRLEPHVLRFEPRHDGTQQLLDFQLLIEPTPAGLSSSLDAAGNAVTHAWWDDTSTSLSIHSRATVRTLRENPYDFLLDRSRTRLPLDYGDEQGPLLPYLKGDTQPVSCGSPLGQLAARVRDTGRSELMPLLGALNNILHERIEVVHRAEGPPWPAEQTWNQRQGACRDLAVLFIDVCRHLGIAARFVSGYEAPVGGSDPYELHAWAEVYVPGGGWRGYDPSRGLATADRHVAVAASPSPAGAAPVTGTFRGTGVTSTFESEILIHQVEFVAAPRAPRLVPVE